MKIDLSKKRAGESGSAVIVVFVLLAVMAVMLVSNAIVLRGLRREIQLVDHRQKMRWEAWSKGTNAPARRSNPPGNSSGN
jgi:hypothetical protein